MSKKQAEQEKPSVTYYKGLPKMLHGVRWTQRFFAILAEVLILIAFFASGMDLGVGGTMANALGLKWAWAAVFALGVDTSFVVSWIRCRQVGRSWHLLWCIPVALGMSFVVFEPVVIQLMQATLNIGFNQAVALLGINLIVLVYGRALVAVILGAVLALTNVESAMSEEVSRVSSGRRVFIPLQKLMDKFVPLIDDAANTVHPEQTEVTNQDGQSWAEQYQVLKSISGYIYALMDPRNDAPFYVGQTTDPSTRFNDHLSGRPSVGNKRIFDELADQGLKPEMKILETVMVGTAKSEREQYWIDELVNQGHHLTNIVEPSTARHIGHGVIRTPKLQAVLSPIERVKQALDTNPDASDRQIAKMSNVSPTTAGKYKKLLASERREASS